MSFPKKNSLFRKKQKKTPFQRKEKDRKNVRRNRYSSCRGIGRILRTGRIREQSERVQNSMRMRLLVSVAPLFHEVAVLINGFVADGFHKSVRGRMSIQVGANILTKHAGGCGVLLRASTQFDEPRVFAPTRIYQDGGTLYVIEFMVSATQLCEIRIDEDADIESGESLFSQQFTAIGSGGSGGSGTVTTEAFSDINDYNEVK